MSIEEFERQQMLLSLYGKLGEAEIEVSQGETGEAFFEFAKKLRESVHGHL